MGVPPASPCACGPLIDQPAKPRRPTQQRPARATGLRLGYGGEFRVPGAQTAEVAFQRLGQAEARRWITTLATKRIEVDLVQNDGTGGDQLLALHAVDLEH